MTPLVRRALLGATLALLAACHDSPTEPPKRADVVVELMHPVDYQYIVDADGIPRVSCDAYLRAKNRGAAPGWLGALKVYLFAGKSRTVPLDSAVLSDAANAWDQSVLAPGDTATSIWRMSAAIPFGATFEFRTMDDHGESRTRVSFPCGPVPPPSPPPAVSGVTLSMEPDSAPGSTLIVHYTVDATAGLWRTTIAMDGPCQASTDVYDHGIHATTHDVRLYVPPTCALGVPLSVSVSALDIGADVGMVTVQSAFTLADRKPPTLAPLFLSGGRWSSSLGGSYLADDTLLVDPQAADNNRLKSISWTTLPSGETDSIAVGGQTSAGRLLRIPVRASWASTPPQLRIVARDVAGNADTVLVGPGTFTIVPLVTRSSITTHLSGILRDIVPDGRHGRVYALLADRVVILSATTLAPIDVIPISLNAAALDLTAGGDTLVVAPFDMDSLAIVDLDAPAATRVHDVPVTMRPAGIAQGSGMVAVGADGKAYIIRAFTASDWAVVSHDLATGAEQRIDGTYYLLGRSLDHSVIAVEGSPSCSALYVIARAAVSSCAPVTSDPSLGLWGDRTGSRFAAGLAIWDVGSNAVSRVALPASAQSGPVNRSVLSPDGADVYIGLRGHLLHARASDASLIDASRVPDSQVANGPYDIFRIAEDGSFIIAATGVLGTPATITRIALP